MAKSSTGSVARLHPARSLLLSALFGTMLTLGACDKLASAPTVEQTLQAAQLKLASQDTAGAIVQLQSHIKSHGDAGGRLHWALARAQAQAGAFDAALSALQAALSAGAVSAEQAMVEIAFAALRTDIRFVSLLTGTAMAAPAPQVGDRAPSPAPVAVPPPLATSAMPGHSATTGTVSVSLDGPIQARAGGVVASVPK